MGLMVATSNAGAGDDAVLSCAKAVGHARAILRDTAWKQEPDLLEEIIETSSVFRTHFANDYSS
jgi:hypothetical protein